MLARSESNDRTRNAAASTPRSSQGGPTKLLAATLDYQPLIPRLELPPTRTVVVVPHPDDEALSTGGLIAHQGQCGLEVVVVAVTDGEHAYADWPAHDLAQRRRAEQLAALEQLAADITVIRLQLTDGGVANQFDQLADLLDDIVCPGDLVVAPDAADWHPDHIAAGAAAALVAEKRHAEFLGSLFWAHHHPNGALDGRLCVLELTDDETKRRSRAVQSHRSQLWPEGLEPVVTPELWNHLQEPFEYFVVSS
jgi:LmbE family N-acetylglucosaminyl deacetylase